RSISQPNPATANGPLTSACIASATPASSPATARKLGCASPRYGPPTVRVDPGGTSTRNVHRSPSEAIAQYFSAFADAKTTSPAVNQASTPALHIRPSAIIATNAPGYAIASARYTSPAGSRAPS